MLNLFDRCVAEVGLAKSMNISFKKAGKILDGLAEEVKMACIKDMLRELAITQRHNYDCQD